MSNSLVKGEVLTAETREYIESLRKKYNVKGIAVSVVSRDKAGEGYAYETPCFGVSDVKDTPMNEDNIFIIASASKIFTVVGIGLLIEEKFKLPNGTILGWDTKIKDILKEWKLMDDYATDHVDIRDLLSMRWGIPGHQPSSGIPDEPANHLLDILPHLRPSCEIRQYFQYTNIGFAIVAHIISHLTGKAFEEYIREKIFAPLGMDSTMYDKHAAERSGRRAQGFGRLGRDPTSLKSMAHGEVEWDVAACGEPIALPFWQKGTGSYFYGAGGVWTTPSDIAKWTKELLSPSLIPASLITLIQTPLVPTGEPSYHPFSSGTSYGLGQFIEHYRDNILIQHAGGIPTFHTASFRVPAKHFGAFVMVTDDSIGHVLHTVIALRIADELLNLPVIDWDEVLLGKLLKNPTVYPPPPDNAREPLPETQVVGIYHDPAYGHITIVKLDDHPDRNVILPLLAQNPINTLPGLQDRGTLYVGEVDQETEITGRLLFVPYNGPIYTRAFIKTDRVVPTPGRSPSQEYVGGMWNVGKAVFTPDGFGMFENYWWKGAMVKESVLSENETEKNAEVWYKRIQ